MNNNYSDKPTVTVPETVIDPDDDEGIVLGLIAYSAVDDRKAQYLAYRSCGFGVKDSIALVQTDVTGKRDLNERTIRRWRKQDPEFGRLDGVGLAELRSSVALEVNALRFTRNLTLALERDYVILRKALLEPILMTKEDHRLYREIRKFYTFQQMEALKKLMISGSDNDADYTELVLRMSKKQTIEVRKIKGK